MKTPHKDTPLLLTAENLEVAYRAEVALSIPHISCSGRVIAVVGHNGAGKSTFIKSILKLLPPQRGVLSVSKNGEELVPERDMAFCPETGSVFTDISVEEYLAFWCRVKAGNSRYYMKEGGSILEELEIAPLLKKLGRELSKGQRRRVQTAIGFLFQPKLFLFDEPFEGLDVQRSHDLTKILQRASSSMSCVVTSHRMEVLERLADVVILLEKGKVRTFGTIPEVVDQLVAFQFEVTSDAEKIEKVFTLLSARFPAFWLTQQGAVLSIAGGQKYASQRDALLFELKEAGLSPLSVRSSLSDAMNVHLRMKGEVS